MDRAIKLNSNKPKTDGACVIYFMSRDQRVQDNHALLLAQEQALLYKLPLLVVFNLNPNIKHRAKEHYEFMIDGLKEVEQQLDALHIEFSIIIGSLVATVQKLHTQHSPNMIIFDVSPLRGLRSAQKQVARIVACQVLAVDTHNIIPIWKASDKQEFAAHTFRRKVHRLLESYIQEPRKPTKMAASKNILKKHDWNEITTVISNIKSNNISVQYRPGELAAQAHLTALITTTLASYADGRNNPNLNEQSNLSPYLHFGHISSLRVVLEVMKSVGREPLLFREPRMAKYQDEPTIEDSMNVLFEELIVRKELSDNYCFYNENYDSLKGAESWALKTLDEHLSDKREYEYSRQDLESATTHDPAWNAAQRQMLKTGKMHGYMRMYWAKKILEWSPSPTVAIETAIYLNDTYSIDGGDPNGFAGILWSIAGLHDRAWTERPVFGKIRFMNYAGLKRKFDIATYEKQWND